MVYADVKLFILTSLDTNVSLTIYGSLILYSLFLA